MRVLIIFYYHTNYMYHHQHYLSAHSNLEGYDHILQTSLDAKKNSEKKKIIGQRACACSDQLNEIKI